MLMGKIRHGLLQVSTDHGARYVEPSLLERLRLLWMFRNFRLLPQEVLNEHEQALVRHLCNDRRLERRRDVDPDAVIGIVESKGFLPPKKQPLATARAHQHTA